MLAFINHFPTLLKRIQYIQRVKQKTEYTRKCKTFVEREKQNQNNSGLLQQKNTDREEITRRNIM